MAARRDVDGDELGVRLDVDGWCNWELLDTTGRPLIERVLNKWKRLVQGCHREEVYHRFLAEHAALFFFNGCDHYLTLSKIRLGSDHVIDLAVPHEGYSDGLSWNLIELETPHCPPYSKKGDPSKGLSHGLQQIRNWKRWVLDNRAEARRVFPCMGVRTLRNPTFSFTLIIGTTENSSGHLEERNQLADLQGIRIRSFDFLSRLLVTHVRFNEFRFLDGDFRFPAGLGNRLANPFTMAIPDQEWRTILREAERVGTFSLPKMANILVEHRPYNTRLLSQFKELCGDAS